MKKILLSFILFIQTLIIYAQVPIPTNFQTKSFQHEVKVSWKLTFNTQWEVSIEGRPSVILEKPQIIIEQLNAGHDYNIQITAIRNGERSETAKLIITTKPLTFSIDSDERIPYLRTITLDGRAPQKLPLYFNELADNVENISYRLNGEIVHPVNNHLELNPNVLHNKLEVKIKETSTREWTLRYFNLSILK